MDYRTFVEERHRVYERRQAGASQPWTDEPILQQRKFTNVFRVLDYGSQFALTQLYQVGLSERELMYRFFLYRHTGRVPAWEWYLLETGDYPLPGMDRQVWKEYRGAGKKKDRTSTNPRYNPKASEWVEYTRSVFTNAYLVFPQSQERGTDKLDSIVDLAERLFTPGSPDDIMPAWELARTHQERFRVLVSPKGVGNFMAMQVLTDWSYTRFVDHENDYVVAGPGAIKGAAALAPGRKAEDVIREQWEHWQLEGPRLGDRAPSLMDVQNTLCEYSKVVRYLGQTPKAAFVPDHPGAQPEPILPAYY